MKFDTRTVLWSLLKYIGSGIVIMWLTFWYLSGSFWGLPRLFVAYYAASQVFMTPMSKATLYDGMLKGLIGSLGEPHSIYLDADEFKSMKMQTSGTYAGVGMVLGHDDKGLYAVSIMEDQPAFKAGIKPGDHIIAIDGQSTSDITVEDASSRIRGEAGTIVALDIERNGEKLHFDITRESIVLPTVKSKMLTSTVGYIRITIISRSREIQIMRLVGAKNSYIRGPFLLEGAWIGLVTTDGRMTFIILGVWMIVTSVLVSLLLKKEA